MLHCKRAWASGLCDVWEILINAISLKFENILQHPCEFAGVPRGTVAHPLGILGL